jgi:hypothetical protein
VGLAGTLGPEGTTNSLRFTISKMVSPGVGVNPRAREICEKELGVGTVG